MRISPILMRSGKNNSIATRGQAFNNNISQSSMRKYTGNPAQDLATASMYDSKIAQELKIMGLI